MTPQLIHDPDRAEDIIRELIEVCRKRGCVLLPGNGVFYLARMEGDLQSAILAQRMVGARPKAQAIAQIREINPTCAEWCGTDQETKVVSQ